LGSIESSFLNLILSFEAYHFPKNDNPRFPTKREGISRQGMGSFASMTESYLVLDLPDLVLLQFRFGLLRDSDMTLDAMSGGAFVFLEPE
jgi:hypothetical protein